jgi:hypothetical protein
MTVVKSGCYLGWLKVFCLEDSCTECGQLLVGLLSKTFKSYVCQNPENKVQGNNHPRTQDEDGQ